MKKQEENMKQQKKTKSIGEKMKSTHTYQRQEEILLDWRMPGRRILIKHMSLSDRLSGQRKRGWPCATVTS